ncbi:MAG: tRNA (adenosine(37)-N6)-threonylcarbamoyltransferase complex dimerization subunit type 1 TsaB [candidate division Zixibacteria bacterium]|nr:tRNA (adenosine(37)-N6)-threonylcarbamoyltransferase complex dimerization subunit type 1 TsaB [candidate division Zixibacteria bacterium]
MTDSREMNVLAIDTATATLNLAVSFGGDRLVKLSEQIGISHGRILIKKISDLLESAGLDRGDLDGIVASTGPGSFTGLRVGLAAAKGIAVAIDIPIVGVSLFDVAAHRLGERDAYVVVPFKRDEYFVTLVTRGTWTLENVTAVAKTALAEFVGNLPVAAISIDLAGPYPQLTLAEPSGRIEYDGGDLLVLGQSRLSAGESDDIARLEPLYLMKSQAEIRYARQHREK